MFRADSSAEVGGGHVRRCLTLADALRARGWRATFAARPGTGEAAPWLGRSGNDVVELDCAEEDEPATLSRAWPAGAELLVVDHYGRDRRLERACRPWARRIMVIDDLHDRPHDCDILLDQTLGRSNSAYDGLVPEGCRLLLGAGFALLAPAFAAARGRVLARRATSGTEKILVAFGATDPKDATSLVLEGLARARGRFAATVVLGPAAPHLDRVQRLAAQLPPPAEIRVGLDSGEMAALMANSDLAIGAGGTSSWERCCLGLPALVLVTAPDQREVADSLARAGAALVVGEHPGLAPGAVARALEDWAGAGLG
ncbi:MAG: UDP-2,4-diacetamido-2,4,6-trideoxy-beta-L-altropyranose hydrolase, partial [Alphaproteobacteria bacterium]